MTSPHFILLSEVQDPRTTLFQEALQQAALPPAQVVSYLDAAQSPQALLNAIDQTKSDNILLRIDSFGRDLNVRQMLLEKGADQFKVQGKPYVSKQTIAEHLAEKGRIVAPHQDYAGFSALMQSVQNTLTQANKPVRLMNPISDILLMSDKAACHHYLSQHSIPVAKALPPIKDYDDLRDKMRSHHLSRVFVKLKHGAAASGIVALEASGKRVQIKTTVEMVEQEGELAFYNSRLIRTIRDEKHIKSLIDKLCTLDVHVEQWIPKAQVNGHSVDLRILVIGGEVCHQILRMSRTPITNLHLLNQRADANLLQQKMTDENWQNLLNTCKQVAQLFPNCLYVALDVLVDISLKKHAVLELNAFGDFVKDVYHHGLTPYQYEIKQLQQQGFV